jgi:hypothetical protein
MIDILKEENKMDTSAQTITTMGDLSEIVYNDNKEGIDYFKKNYVFATKDGTTYKVIDHTPASNSGFNALLLQEEGTHRYVIAFRGTQEKIDIVDDAIIGLHNYSVEFQQAKADAWGL